MALINRYQWRAYMNTGTVNAANWKLMGTGFTQLSESKNPKEYSRQYVHEKTERTDVVGYAPSLAYSVDVYDDDPVIAKIVEVTDKELIGTDAQVEIVAVNTWDAIESYVKTTDESIVPGKTYYTKNGDTYTAVDEPSAEGLGDYYERNTAARAYKRTYAVIPDARGDGTDALIYTGTLRAVSDIIEGTWTGGDTGSFTPNA